MTLDELAVCKPGTRVRVLSGTMKGVYLKLALSNDVALRMLENAWVSLETGVIYHYSWLAESDTKLIHWSEKGKV